MDAQNDQSRQVQFTPNNPSENQKSSSRLNKSRIIGILAVLTIIAAIPLTIKFSQQTQTIKQEADTKRFSGIGRLPAFNDLEDLEQQLRTTLENGRYPIGRPDYELCPDMQAGQPGYWDRSSLDERLAKRELSCDVDMCGDPGNETELDHISMFGTVLPSTDPNDPFFTSPRALIEARWAGNERHSVANPHDRGINWNVREYIPGEVRAGGWHYTYGKDNACFGVSTYQCGVDRNGRTTGGGRDGWAQVMGRAQRAVTRQPNIDRRCALAIAAMEVRSEWEGAYDNEFDGNDEEQARERYFAQHLDPSTKNREGTGFKATSWSAPIGTTCNRCSNNDAGRFATFQTNEACPNGVSQTAAPIEGTITHTDKPSCTVGDTPQPTTCHRCSNINSGKWATFTTIDACPNGVSDTAEPIPGTPITYEDRAECNSSGGPNPSTSPSSAPSSAPSSSPSNAPSTAPSSSPSTSPNPNATVLNVSVILHGIGAGGDSENPDASGSNKDPKTSPRPAKLLIADALDSEESRKEMDITLEYKKDTGKYTAAVGVSSLNLESGNYIVKVKTYSFLVKRLGTGAVAITKGQTKALPEAQLITADTDNNNELKVDDYNAIRGCIESHFEKAKSCDAAQKKAADVNDDGVVNVTDYTLFIRELARRQGE